LEIEMPATTETKTAEALLFGHYLRTGQRLSGAVAERFLERKFNQRHYRENGQFARAGEGVSYGGGAPSSSNESARQSRGSGTAQRQIPTLRTNDRSANRNEEIVVIGDPKLQKLRDAFDATFAAKPVGRPTTATRTTHHQLITRLGSVITIGEGNYEAYNSGTKGVKYDRVGHSFVRNAPATVTGKTINQILATEVMSGYDRRRMFATGKYQTTIPTLRDAKRALKLTGDELYTPELQERVFREYLIYKAGGGKLAAFVVHGRGSVDDAQYAASQEWASIGVPAGFVDKYGVVSNGNRSYYQKAGQNVASGSATRSLRSLLIEIAARR
jgi:hypothetical protein